jgi:16S rRNA (cytosine967-C5)-methyltransferase
VADKRASESVLMGSDLYAPGVVMASGFSQGDMVSIYSENGVHVGSGRAMISPEEMIRRKKGLAVRVTEPIWRSYRVHDLPGYREGLIYGQSITSMYVARMLNPEPGDRIIDVTAAPGGKITHAVQLAGGRVEAIAVDRPSKRRVLLETLERLSMHKAVRVISGDSRRLTRDYPSLRGWATKVIVDPPCTNLGVRPKVYDLRMPKHVRNAALYQRSILYEAVRVAAPGALIAYSTCTLTLDENDSNVAWAVDHLGLEIVRIDRFTRPRPSGLGYWFSPLDGIPGFYIALMRKSG